MSHCFKISQLLEVINKIKKNEYKVIVFYPRGLGDHCQHRFGIERQEEGFKVHTAETLYLGPNYFAGETFEPNWSPFENKESRFCNEDGYFVRPNGFVCEHTLAEYIADALTGGRFYAFYVFQRTNLPRGPLRKKSQTKRESEDAYYQKIHQKYLGYEEYGNPYPPYSYANYLE